MPCSGTVGPLEGQMGFRHGWLCGLGDMGLLLAHCWAWLGPCVAVSMSFRGTQHWDWSTGGWGWVPSADSLKGVFLNGVCQYWRYHSRKTPHGCLPCVSPRESQCLLPLQEALQDGQVYDLGSFQTPVLTLRLRTDENLCVPFKSGVCFQYPQALLNTSFTGFQSQAFWAPGAGPPSWEARCGGWTLLLGITPRTVIFLLFVGG